MMPTDPASELRLPIEVIELVIDSVHELVYEGTVFLELYTIWKACALTCHAMLPRSQFWLFHEVVLSTETQALNFAAILLKNVAVAPHVQILTLSGPLDDQDKRRFTWISWVPLVLAPRMKNLQELNLEQDVFRDCHPDLSRALTAFKSIRRLRFNETSFSTFGHCVRLSRAFPHLRHLYFCNTSWKPDLASSQSMRRGRSQRRRIQLAHLDLVGEQLDMRSIVKWLLDIEAPNSLVTFYGYPEQHEIIQDVAFINVYSMAFHSALDFSIQFPDYFLNNLQTVHLQMSMNTFPVQLIISIGAAAPQLRELTVYVRIEDEQTNLEETPEDPAAYTQLDAALGKPALSALRLIVCLYDEGASVEAVDQWQRWIAGRLPRLYSHEGRLACKRILSAHPLWRWWKERDGFS